MEIGYENLRILLTILSVLLTIAAVWFVVSFVLIVGCKIAAALCRWFKIW